MKIKFKTYDYDCPHLSQNTCMFLRALISQRLDNFSLIPWTDHLLFSLWSVLPLTLFYQITWTDKNELSHIDGLFWNVYIARSPPKSQDCRAGIPPPATWILYTEICRFSYDWSAQWSAEGSDFKTRVCTFSVSDDRGTAIKKNLPTTHMGCLCCRV